VIHLTPIHHLFGLVTVTKLGEDYKP